MEIVAGVLSFVYRHDIENFLYKELMTGIRKHYPHESQPDVDGLRATWGFLQTEVRTQAMSGPDILDQELTGCKLTEKSRGGQLARVSK